MSRARGEWRPTREHLDAARDRTVPDVIAPGLDVLFCGINPGLYSGAVGHHFARPGNRFWPALAAAGFTDRVLTAFEERELLRSRLGVTNMVARTTASAAELDPAEVTSGGSALRSKVIRYAPRYLAVLGLGAYRTAFGRARATIGLQEDVIGPSSVWLLPNPSGLNAHYQLDDLARAFAELRAAL